MSYLCFGLNMFLPQFFHAKNCERVARVLFTTLDSIFQTVNFQFFQNSHIFEIMSRENNTDWHKFVPFNAVFQEINSPNALKITDSYSSGWDHHGKVLSFREGGLTNCLKAKQFLIHAMLVGPFHVLYISFPLTTYFKELDDINCIHASHFSLYLGEYKHM